jgi:outer membrane protein insertion porin family
MNKLRSVFILIAAIFGFQQVNAQITIDYTNPKEYFISDISISGIKFLNHGALVQLSGLTKGQKIKVPGDAITNALKKLWKQGLFSDVKITYTKIEGDSIYLDIYLQEMPRLSQIVFSGVNNTQAKELKDKIDLKRGKQVTENVINNTKNIIRNHYVNKGFYNTEVTITTKDDTTYQNTVVLFINVNKKEKVKIKEISFNGNSFFTAKKLRKFLKNTKQKRWYGLFKPSKFIPSKYKEDKLKFIEKINEKGFRDAKILKDSISIVDNKTIKINIDIIEGNKYYFRNIKWVGNTKFTSELLTKALKIKSGDVYDQALLEKRLSGDEDAVSSLYMDDGYLFYNVTPVEMQVVNDSIDIELRMVEGPQATINNVTITGNTRTNDYVVRRELRTYPGELFKRSDVIRSIRELANLGHFDPEKIVPTPKPDPSNGTVDLEYSLVEKANDQVELSGGWGAGMIVGTLGLSFNNFSTKNIFDKKAWQPLPTGDGQKLSIRAQTNGTYYQSYSISFVEPWLGGKKRNSLSVSLYYNLMSKYSPYYSSAATTASSDGKMKVLGASLGLGRTLNWPDDYFTLYNEVSFRRYHLNSYQFSYDLPADSGNFSQLAFNTVLERNSVSQPIYPRFGSDFSLGLEFTLPFSKWNNKNYSDASVDIKYKWLEYYKWTFKASWFTALIGDLVLNAKAEYGFVGYYNSQIGPTPFEGYEVGGDGMSYSYYGKTVVGLRGYENGAITASKRANLYAKYCLELRYPITLSNSANIYALSFLEAGNGWSSFKEINPFGVYRSAGVGVRVFLPMLGLLGIDWGYGFDKLPGTSVPAGGKFSFVMGQQF